MRTFSRNDNQYVFWCKSSENLYYDLVEGSVGITVHPAQEHEWRLAISVQDVGRDIHQISLYCIQAIPVLFKPKPLQLLQGLLAYLLLRPQAGAVITGADDVEASHDRNVDNLACTTTDKQPSRPIQEAIESAVDVARPVLRARRCMSHFSLQSGCKSGDNPRVAGIPATTASDHGCIGVSCRR